MRLQRLTALERDKVLQEYEEIQKTVAYLQSILADESILQGVIREELLEIQRVFGTPRRTEILDQQVELTLEDLIAEETVVITATRAGYIKRTPLDIYKSQGRGGKGRRGMSTRTAEDIIEYLFVASTHSYILVFTSKGRVYWLKVYTIPSVAAAGKGRPIVNLIQLDQDEKIADILAVDDFESGDFLFMVSRRGYIKRTRLQAFSNPRKAGIIACGVDEGDELFVVDRTSGRDHILLCTRGGQAIRFREQNVREMGRTARGVRGIKLKDGDEIVSACVAGDETGEILSATENGYGKRTPLAEYRLQNRAGQGIINIKTTERNGQVIGACRVKGPADVILITTNGKIIRLETETIRKTATRAALGVKLIDLGEEDKLADITLIPEGDEDEFYEGAG
jgi:DNA gyrase subunit A